MYVTLIGNDEPYSAPIARKQQKGRKSESQGMSQSIQFHRNLSGIFARAALHAFATATCIGVIPVALAQPCPDSSVADYKLAIAALNAAQTQKALPLLESATAACDHATYWQALGDAHLTLLDARPDTDTTTHASDALAAYGRAFASARSAQDDAAGAQAARSVADLGLRSGDPLKAQNWLLVATRLEPSHPDLADLQQRVDLAREQLSASEIEMGLSQTRGIGTVNKLLGGKVSSNAFWDPTDESAGGAGGTPSASGSISMPAEPTATESSIDIPIRFASNSTALTPETAENVRNLAAVLTLQDPASHITLTGHADVRGDADYNQRLSLARAEAIRDRLVDAEPALQNRIDATGAGESRPIDPGNTARAHANNRRLAVTVTVPVVQD